MPKYKVQCPECKQIYIGQAEYGDKMMDEILTLSKPCRYCKNADKAAKDMLGDLYVSIEERKK